MKKFLAISVLAISVLMASCTKKEDVEEKLVGTWLMKTNGWDVNGNSTYDNEERTPLDSGDNKVTLSFKADGTFVQLTEEVSPGITKKYPGKWEVQKKNTGRLNLVFDDGISVDAGIEVLNDQEFVMEHTPGFWNGYVRQ